MTTRSMIDSLIHKTTELTADVADKSKWGLFFAPFLIFIERYVFSDWPFLVFLITLIALDTCLAVGHALYKWTFSPGRLAGVLVKFVVYGSVLVVGHVIENVEVSAQNIPGGTYFKMVIYSAVLLVESTSCFKNLGKINKNLVPLFILKRFEDFNETGDFSKLTGSQPIAQHTTHESNQSS
jgi:hypothetical protein